MKDAIKRGLSADAAVERVQNDTRARMLRQEDPYWQERLKDRMKAQHLEEIRKLLSGAIPLPEEEPPADA